jgi:hypothetical protein
MIFLPLNEVLIAINHVLVHMVLGSGVGLGSKGVALLSENFISQFLLLSGFIFTLGV